MKRTIVGAVNVDGIQHEWSRAIDARPACIAYTGAIEARAAACTAIICENVANPLPAECGV
jgi:hypothetical protein